VDAAVTDAVPHGVAPAPDVWLASVARGGLANLVGAAFAGLSGFVVTWLVARALGTVAAGAFFASTAAFVLIATVAKLGTQTSLVYWPARLRALGQTGALRACLRAGIVPVLVFSGVVAVAMWLGADLLARVAVRDGHAEYARQLRLLAWFLPVAAASDALLAANRGLRAMRPTVLLDRLLRPALQVAVLALLIGYGIRTAPAFVLAWVAPYLPSALLSAVSLRRALTLRVAVTPRAAPAPPPGGVLPHLRSAFGVAPDRSGRRRRRYRNPDLLPQVSGRPTGALVDGSTAGVFGEFWRFTAPRAVASIAQLALQRVDVLLLAGIAGLRAAAVYAVAGRFVVLGQFANQGISQAVQPRLAELLATDDRAGASRLYQTATAWLILAAWPIYLLIAVYAGAYLGVFGAGYHAGAPVVVVLAAAMTVATGCGMVDMVLAMAGRTSWNLANVSVALAIQLVIDMLLITRLGPLGAAIGLGVAIVVTLSNIVGLLIFTASKWLLPG
jgi:O-antigen/teichoic acid export membrane protein